MDGSQITSEYSDINLVILETESDMSMKRPCHKYVLSKSSSLFKDIISVMNPEDPNLNIYVNNKEELKKLMEVLSFIYDPETIIPLDCVDVILKHQLNTASDWLLQNRLFEIDSKEDVENLYMLTTNKCLWNSLNEDNKHVQPILLHLFVELVNFNNTKCYNTFLRNIQIEHLIDLVKHYKEYNTCHDIISIIVIKWISFHKGHKDSIKLIDKINFKCLSRSLRNYWMNSVHKLGDAVMKNENGKIIELLTKKMPHYFQFDSTELRVKNMFDLSELNNIRLVAPIDNTFYNIEIVYNDNKFTVKLNDLNRYNLEEVDINVTADINLNIVVHNYPHWVHITGNFKSFPTVKDTLVYNYDVSNFDNVNEDDIVYHDANVVKIIADVILKN